MKRFLTILALIICLVGLSSCKFFNNLFDDGLSGEELKYKLIETRNEIQEKNIVVKTTIDLGFLLGTVTQEGSGVVIASDETYYYILTNRHVVDYKGSERNPRIEVRMTTYFEDVFVPERLNGSTDYDLALFRVTKTKLKHALEPINITARLEQSLVIGEMVLACGNPGLTTFNVTFGTYEGKVILKDVSYRVLRHNATIFQGNSGGALTDVDGNLIGINTWGYEDSRNAGFAIGLEEIHEFLRMFEPFSGE